MYAVTAVLWLGGMKNDINNYVGNTGVYEEINTCWNKSILDFT